MKTAQWLMPSKMGPLYLVASEKSLLGLYWKKQTGPLVESLNSSEPEVKILKRAAQEIEEYLSGDRKEFEVPIDLKGTPFQEQVWQQLRKIPYGQTISYKELAKKIKNEKAIRAVGTANGRNPISLIVPCHRVIASDGTLGGYAGGVSIKDQLLKLESEQR